MANTTDATNRSQGPVQVIEMTPTALNDALRELVRRIDFLRGLQGRVLIYNRVRVDDPVADDDAVNLAFGNDSFVTIETEQTVSGKKTFTGQVVIQGTLTVSGVSTFSANVAINANLTIKAPGVFRFIDTDVNANQLLHAFGTAT